MSDNKLKTIDHQDPEVGKIIDELKEAEGSCHLLLLTGPYIKGKRVFLETLSSSFGKKISHIDLRDLVSLDLNETRQNLDDLFNSLTDDDELLFFSNGDRLCGAYTGFTHSKTRYMTPQGRYFLQKLSQSGNIILLDIQDEDNVDKTLERKAHSRIRFGKPGALFKRLTWNLGNITFHGHTFTSKRPVRTTAR